MILQEFQFPSEKNGPKGDFNLLWILCSADDLL